MFYSLVNSLFCDIAPENHAGSENVVKGCSRFCVVDDRSHFTMVERDFADVMATSKEQGSMSLCGFTFRVVTWIPQITGYAFTLIGEKLIIHALNFFPGNKKELAMATFYSLRLVLQENGSHDSFIKYYTLNDPRSFVHNCEHDPGMSHSLMSSQVLLSTSL